MNPRSVLLAIILLLTLSVARAAAADPAAAEALFQEGVQLASRGELQKACDKFEASETLDVAVGTLLRLGDCYERTGRLASAWSRFREAASLSQAQAMREREHIANVRAAALEARMARVTISVPAEPPVGFQVRLGTTVVPRASWGSALPMDAGTQALEASAPGYTSYRRQVSVPAVKGARIIVTVPQLSEESAASAADVAIGSAPLAAFRPERSIRVSSRGEVVDHGYAARATGVTLMVVGGIGLATSGVLTIFAKRRNDSSREHCPDSANLCTPRGVELRRNARKLADAATVAVATGGALVAAGFIVYLAAPKRTMESVALDVAPDFNGGMSLNARGAF
jgi:hypothetical protein